MWEIDSAGRQLEEIIRLAHDQGPQPITDEGKRVAMLLIFEEYEKLLAEKQAKT
jgi:prevent-host-death family protein